MTTKLNYSDCITVIIGTAFLGIGAGQIAAHSLSSPATLFDICGNSGALAFWLDTTAHCWGCPVALAGVSLLLIPLFRGHAGRFKLHTVAEHA